MNINTIHCLILGHTVHIHNKIFKLTNVLFVASYSLHSGRDNKNHAVLRITHQSGSLHITNKRKIRKNQLTLGQISMFTHQLLLANQLASTSF